MGRKPTGVVKIPKSVTISLQTIQEFDSWNASHPKNRIALGEACEEGLKAAIERERRQYAKGRGHQ